ncbi:arabinose ABC transporter substrate-binding protein, partial [Mesorhizobium sp. M2D.F.Ca.ET.160.01.1.1]
DHPWFVREVQGAKDKAKELGVDLLVQDVQFDANLAVTTFDTYVGDGVKGIAVVVPDRSLGPVVADKAKAAKIGLIAVDDDIAFADGTPVAYVGMNA